MKAGPMPSDRRSTQSRLDGIGEVFSLILCYLCICFFFTLLVWLIWYGLWLGVFMGFLGVQKCDSLNLYVILCFFFASFFCFVLFCSVSLYFISLLLLDTCLFSNGSENLGSGRIWEELGERNCNQNMYCMKKKSNFLQGFYNSNIL